MNTDIINYFHHIHHMEGRDELTHEVHHCGGDHSRSNPDEGFHCCKDNVVLDARLNYNIIHCKCKKHAIDVSRAIGHDADSKEVIVVFSQRCPQGGFHVESGKIRM